MEAIVERCCGLDVHQAKIVACLLVGGASERPRKTLREFRTVSRELLELRDWLLAEGCTHVGMESTGVYWKPVFALLEDAFEVVVGNARHIRNVPGRKTDVKDAEWISNLLRHGLIAKSFIPDKPIRQLRDLTRYRNKLVQSRTGERNRLHKLLETANVKLSSFVSNVFGVSGMAMLRALLKGEGTPAEIATLAKGRLRSKLADLELALDGRLDEDHRFLLEMQLKRLDEIDGHVADIDRRIDLKLEPYREECRRLDQIHGVDKVVASRMLAEMGPDMAAFRSEQHLASWAGVCPGNHESAGKRMKGTSRPGNVHLTTVLVEAAQAAVRKKGSYLQTKFHRLKARRGYKRALMAIAHKILIAAYHVLRDKQDYRDLGDGYLDQVNRKQVTRSLLKRLENLGYEVALTEKAFA